MIWFGITAALALTVVALTTLDMYREFKSSQYQYRSRFVTFDGFMSALFGTMALLVIATMIGYGLSGLSGVIRGMEPNVSSYEFPIVAIADGSSTSGSFFLFSGSMDETPKYFFYRQDSPDGPIRQGNLSVSKTDVYEDTEREGYIKVIRHSYNCDWLGCDWSSYRTYEVHVPKGSVVRQFNFDLE